MNDKSFAKVETKSAHDQVYDILKRAILAGFFRPGEQVTIRGLAGQLGTSEMPVREAIKRLVAREAIEATSDRKFRIPTLSRKQIKDILALRVLLEGLATSDAAEHMTDRQMARIREIHNDMGKAIESNDAQGLLETNIRFHFTVYSVSPNSALMPLIESLWLQYSPTLTEYVPRIMKRLSREDRQAARILDRERHQRVIDALEARDPEGARKHMQADMEAFMRIVDRIGDDYAEAFEQHRTVGDYRDILLG